MKNRFKKLSTIFFTTIILLSGIGILGVPQKAEAVVRQLGELVGPGDTCASGLQEYGGICEKSATTAQNEKKSSCGWLDLVCDATKFISWALLRIGALVLSLVGLIFNAVLQYTIVDMAQWINDDNGLGGSIDSAWATLRDLANIVFIFILLWAAIQTILELNTQNFSKTIKNIIIIALLINFSMFFSKVVIDASNIVTIGFYNSIFESTKNTSVQITSQTSSTDTTTQSTSIGGFSGVIMKALGIQSWFGKGSLGNTNDISNNLIIGIMGMVTMLILSIVLLVAMIMFVARFILLIFIIILSPLAFIAYVIPALSGNFKKWWDALVDQSFFAPYFMLLMWVAIKLINSLGLNQGGEFGAVISNPQSTVGLFLNFIIVIGFIVGALILSKSMASKTAGFKSISGGVGAVAVGGTALAGRKFIGGGSALISEKYRDKLSQSRAGRAGLWLANKGQNATFDVRGIANTKVGKATGAKELFSGIGEANKDGFKKEAEKEAKAKAQYAKDVYGQTDEEKAKAKELKPQYGESKKIKGQEEKRIINDRQREVDLATLAVNSASNQKEKEIAEVRLWKAKMQVEKKDFDDNEYSQSYRDTHKKIVDEYEKNNEGHKKRMEAYAQRLESKTATSIGAAVGAVVGGVVGGIPGAGVGSAVGGVGSFAQGKKSAAAVRKAAGGKSAAEEADELLKKWKKERDQAEGKGGDEEDKDKKGEGEDKGEESKE